MEKLFDWFTTAFSAPIVTLCAVLAFLAAVVINSRYGPLEPEMIIASIAVSFLVAVTIVYGVQKLFSMRKVKKRRKVRK